LQKVYNSQSLRKSKFVLVLGSFKEFLVVSSGKEYIYRPFTFTFDIHINEWRENKEEQTTTHHPLLTIFALQNACKVKEYREYYKQQKKL